MESKRGGGGYLRIIKLSWDETMASEAKQVLQNENTGLEQWEVEGMLKRLYEEARITKREYFILKSIISRDTLQVELPQRDILRARIIQAALTALNRSDL